MNDKTRIRPYCFFAFFTHNKQKKTACEVCQEGSRLSVFVFFQYEKVKCGHHSFAVIGGMWGKSGSRITLNDLSFVNKAAKKVTQQKLHF